MSRKEYYVIYRQNHREQLLQRARQRRQKDAARIKTNRIQWLKNHRDYYKNYHRQWRTLNADYDKNRTRQWQQKNAARVKANRIQWLRDNPGYYAEWRRRNPDYDSHRIS